MNQTETIYIHSQSDNAPSDINQYISLEFEGHIEEQAYSTRAFNRWIYDYVNGKLGVFVTDVPIPEDYATYLSRLGFNLPTNQIILVEGEGSSLTKKVIHQKVEIL